MYQAARHYWAGSLSVSFFSGFKFLTLCLMLIFIFFIFRWIRESLTMLGTGKPIILLSPPRKMFGCATICLLVRPWLKETFNYNNFLWRLSLPITYCGFYYCCIHFSSSGVYWTGQQGPKSPLVCKRIDSSLHRGSSWLVLYLWYNMDGWIYVIFISYL